MPKPVYQVQQAARPDKVQAYLDQAAGFTVTPQQLYKVLEWRLSLDEVVRRIGDYTVFLPPVFVWGGPGVGKSEIIAQVCAELQRPWLDVRLLHYEHTELKGLLVIQDGVPTEVPPDFLIRFAKVKRGVILFDELNAADRRTQAATYQLMTCRRLGTALVLDETTTIVAAGNRPIDMAITRTLPTPLVSRLMHLMLEPHLPSFRTYQLQQDFVDPLVLAFLQQYPHYLYTLTADHPPNMPFACPRTWEQVMQIRHLAQHGPTPLPEALVHKLVSGLVGTGPAADFATYCETLVHIPSVEEFLAGKPFPDPTKIVGGGIALMTALSAHLLRTYRQHPTVRRRIDPVFKEEAERVVTRLVQGDVHPEMLAFFLADLSPVEEVWRVVQTTTHFGGLARLVQEAAE